MSEKQMHLNFKDIEQHPEEMMQLLKDLHDALATSFVRMNWFASDAVYEGQTSVRAEDIMAEVYMNLAGPYTQLREVLNVPELEKTLDEPSES